MSTFKSIKRGKGDPSASRDLPTIEELRGRTYAVFTNSGVRVDVGRYLSTPAGKKAIREIAGSALTQSPKRSK